MKLPNIKSSNACHVHESKKQGEFLTKHGLGNIAANQHFQWLIIISPQNPNTHTTIHYIYAKNISQELPKGRTILVDATHN
jgi:hypothetical protein